MHLWNKSNKVIAVSHSTVILNIPQALVSTYLPISEYIPDTGTSNQMKNGLVDPIKLIALGTLAFVLWQNVEGFTQATKEKPTKPEYQKRRLNEHTFAPSASVSASESAYGSSSASSSTSAFSPSPVPEEDILGKCGDFAVFGRNAITFSGLVTTITTGNIGVAPGTSITGNRSLKQGSEELNTDAAINCASDHLIAFEKVEGKTCTNQLGEVDLKGMTLTPGVHCPPPGAKVFELTDGALTLDAQNNEIGLFIFQTETTVTTATGTSVILINGAKAKNVYWKVGTSMSLAQESSFVGSVLAGTKIDIGTETSVVGRLLSKTAVNFEGLNEIRLNHSSVPSSTSPTATSSHCGPLSAPVSWEMRLIYSMVVYGLIEKLWKYR